MHLLYHEVLLCIPLQQFLSTQFALVPSQAGTEWVWGWVWRGGGLLGVLRNTWCCLRGWRQYRLGEGGRRRGERQARVHVGISTCLQSCKCFYSYRSRTAKVGKDVSRARAVYAREASCAQAQCDAEECPGGFWGDRDRRKIKGKIEEAGKGARKNRECEGRKSRKNCWLIGLLVAFVVGCGRDGRRFVCDDVCLVQIALLKKETSLV